MPARPRVGVPSRARRPHPGRLALATLVALGLALVPAAPAAAATATDPRAAEVWAFDGDGPMGVASAWDQTTGGEVTVAVLDTGADLGHPDLAPNLWVNPREIPGNGRDDDANGYVDDVHGADVINGDGDPRDDHGHGTHVAGIVAARGGNGIGATGVAWRARLMVVKVLDRGAGGDTGGVARGVDYAVAHGARIINLSLAGAMPSPVLDRALERARDAGVLVVAAAGNFRSDVAVSPAYPAASPYDNVVSVAASDATGALAAISNFGAPVDLAAPGDIILATALGGGYEWRTGTSMAAPMVAGTAALVASAAPWADHRALRDALLGGARRTALPIGGGALDAAGALRRVIAAEQWRTPAPAASSDTAAPAATKTRKATKKRKGTKKRKSTKKRRSTAASREAARRAKARRAALRAAAKARATSYAQARAAAAARTASAARSATEAPSSGVVPVRAAGD